MITSAEAYDNFKIKLNQVSTNGNIHIGKGQFVSIYNEQKDKWLEREIEKTKSTDLQDYIQEFLVQSKSIEIIYSDKERSEFSLPEDYFKYESSYTKAHRGECLGIVLANFQIKAKNRNEILSDANNSPSFDYQETPIILSENSIIVFKSDFEVDEQYLNYYTRIPEIDIEGYTTLSGGPSVTKNPTYRDLTVHKIIDVCVAEVVRIYQSPESFQLAQNRVNED